MYSYPHPIKSNQPARIFFIRLLLLFDLIDGTARDSTSTSSPFSSLRITSNLLSSKSQPTYASFRLNPNQIIQKCLPKLPRKSHPPPVKHQQEKRPPRRRRKLARRPPPRLVTRRRGPRPERRPTLPTSTKVRIAHSILGRVTCLVLHHYHSL